MIPDEETRRWLLQRNETARKLIKHLEANGMGFKEINEAMELVGGLVDYAYEEGRQQVQRTL